MKIRAENVVAAVGELRIGLLAVRDLADTLPTLIEAADTSPSSKGGPDVVRRPCEPFALLEGAPTGRLSPSRWQPSSCL